MKHKTITLALLGAVLAGTVLGAHHALASDHDDGIADLKLPNTNLTDLYVFTEKTADTVAGSANKLVAILNCNPRSLPQQQYYFSTKAKYKIHFSYVGTNPNTNGTKVTADDNAPTGGDDFVLTYQFGTPDTATGKQPVTVTTERGGAVLFSRTTDATGNTLMSTPIGTTPMAAANGGIYTVTGDATNDLTVYAGTRQDPFFFDVEQFFKVRSQANKNRLNPGAAYVGFRNAATSRDFTEGYNVLSIATTIPIALIRGATTNNIFDSWETVEVFN